MFTSTENVEPSTALQLASARVVDIQQKGNSIPLSDVQLFAKLFPHPFPFGYVHPGTERKINVGLQECIKHYLKLSNRRFALDDTFPLIAFDIVSRKIAMAHISLMSKLNGREMSAFECVTASELADQLHQDAIEVEAFHNSHNFTEDSRKEKAKSILKQLQATLGGTE